MQQRAILIILCLGLLVAGFTLLPSAQTESPPKPQDIAKLLDQYPLLFNQPLNINDASMVAIQGIPGIGPVLAGRIVDYREKNGPFVQVEELTRVRGIGQKMLLKIKPYCKLSSAED